MLMEVKAPRRKINRSVLHGLVDYQRSTVCRFWLEGSCRRNPCGFLHQLPEASRKTTALQKLPAASSQEAAVKSCIQSSPDCSERKDPQVCKFWITGNCVHNGKCKYLHSWSSCEDITVKARLQGHRKATTGIVIPSGSSRLCSGSNDGTVRIWECPTGECARVVNLGGKEVGSLISEGSWVFAGMPNTIRAWNFHTKVDLTLIEGPVGQVHAMVTNHDLLLAGAQDGSILVWKCVDDTLESDALLEGHNGAVVSLASGPKRLYSGSVDNTIKVWDLETLQCIETLTGHSSVVTSLHFWDQHLVSSSLDQTIKVWAAKENGALEVIHSLEVEHGVIALSGMIDGERRPVLLASCDDNSVRIYDLPSFSERGRLFTQQEVRSISVGPQGLGLIFTGDAAGEVCVWEWLKKPST